jgi:hypothetical protein
MIVGFATKTVTVTGFLTNIPVTAIQCQVVLILMKLSSQYQNKTRQNRIRTFVTGVAATMNQHRTEVLDSVTTTASETGCQSTYNSHNKMDIRLNLTSN